MIRSSARHRYIVCYDVREPKRLRKTHDTMLGYGDPIQYSVFLCDLSRGELVLMEGALSSVANLSEDAVHVIELGPAQGLAQGRIRNLGGAALPASARHRVV
jgi:CRISPR-associated protein Cas2